MSKPTKRDQQMRIKCSALAYHFEKGMRNAHDLADILNTRHELIRRWAKRPEFHEALDTLGYTGDRNFTRRRRDVTREQPAYETATRLYQQLADAGVPKDQRIKEVAHLLGGQYSVQRINSWIKRYLDELNSPGSEKETEALT